MASGGEITLDTKEDASIMVFTLIGDISIEGDKVKEKTAAKLTNGDKLTIKNESDFAQVLFISSRALNEPIAWAGPIVMNSKQELKEAFNDLETGNFIRNDLTFEK